MAAKPAPAFGASPSGGGLMFGAGAGTTPLSAPASSAAPALGAFSFGAPTSAAPVASVAPTLNFGAPAPTLNFGAPAPTATAPTLGGLGGPGGLGGLGGFNFGATTSAAPASSGFSFGTTTAPTNAFGLGSNTTGLFGKPPGAAIDPSKPPPPASIGLGGVDATGGSLIGGISGAGTDGTAAAGSSAPAPKSIALPAELATTVDAFKENVRQRKQLSSDIARCSIRPLHKVDSDADALLRETTELGAALAARRRTANNLRCRGGSSLPAVERAHRITETPHGLEYESADVVAWITEVVAEGENRLVLLRRQLEAAQQQLDASQKPVTDDELALGMRRIHESFIAVAGRLQAVHQQVEAQKAQYLSLRRNILKDPTDIFAKKKGTSSDTNLNYDWLSNATKSVDKLSSGVVSDPLTALGLSQSTRGNSTTGPNPFSNLSATSFGGLPFGYNKIQTTATPSSTSLGGNAWGTSLQTGSFGGLGTQSGFGGFSGLGNIEQSPFSLQKPPAGNKRGKY